MVMAEMRARRAAGPIRAPGSAQVLALMLTMSVLSPVPTATRAHAVEPAAQPTSIRDAAAPAPKPSRWVKPAGQWIDNNTAVFGCLTGFSLGALTLGVPPNVSWAFYVGVPIGTGSMVMRSALGCYVGLLGAGAFSVSASLWDRVDGAWQSLWRPAP